MTNDQIESHVSRILTQLSDNSIRGAIDSLREFASVCAPDLTGEIDSLEQRYFYMLRFLSEGGNVPDIETESAKLIHACEVMCERLDQEARVGTDSSLYYSQMRYNRLRPEENLESLVSDYLSEHTRLRTDTAVLTDSRANTTLEQLANDIFNRIWTSYPLSSDEEQLMENILGDTELPAYDREMWVGALGLGLFQRHDDARMRLLESLRSSGEQRLAAAAAVWLYADAARRIGDRTGRMTRLYESSPEDFMLVALEMTRARGTEKLSEEVRSDIMPRMFDMGREMAQRLYENRDTDIDDLLRNSEWTPDSMKSGDFDMLKGFAEAQQQGEDVYMASLGQGGLRQYPFFHKVSSWFLPFHTRNSELAEIADGEGAAFAETLNRVPFFCDSDKYALAISLANTPPQMQQRGFSAMALSYSQLNSEEFDEALSKSVVGGRISAINNYIKNLYRFFRLFRRKGEFTDIFDITEVGGRMPDNIVTEDNAEDMAVLAELMMKKKGYEDAANLFDALLALDPENAVYLQKAGFCYEMAGLDYISETRYERALEINPADLWTAMRLSDINMRNGMAENAVKLLSSFVDTQHDNPDFLRALGQAYVQARMFAEAAKTYYNLDFILPDDDNTAKPPLAWALTASGDYASAEAIYEAFIADSKSPEVLLNHAHLLWAQGRTEEAIEAYRRYVGVIGDDGLRRLRREINVDVALNLRSQIGENSYVSLLTVPDLLEYRIYGSRNGNI